MSQNSSERKPSGISNPFPGLRPFSRDEASLFFGREGQSQSVLENLRKNRFVAVIGASGSGKSSLIYCGVVPGLLGRKEDEGWKIVIARPGNNPVKSLAESFAVAYPGTGSEEGTEQILGSNVSLAGWLAGKRKTNEKTLLIIDQFEELFRFSSFASTSTRLNETARFVELLVEAVRKVDSGIWLVITMRSDFIGECSAYQELTALINESNYLIPQMTREDFRKAIVKPVELGGASISENLVGQLLDELGNNTDQLPVLQHAMMRTWDYWQLQNNREKPISAGDYEAIGRMAKALSDHADEAFDELDERQREICEGMFKTLTEKGGDNRGVRRPSSIRKIAEIARCTPEEVIEVADKFRSRGRTFLTPYQPVSLTADSIVDISHEALMRIWDRLRLWVDEEDASVQMYNRLSEAAKLFQEGRTSLWRPPDLQLALNWREKQRPTLTWAMQYNPAFERAIVYLETSDKEFRKEEENKIRLQKRRLRITRTFALILGGIAIVAIALFLWTRDLRNKAVAAQEQATQSAQEALDQKSIAEQKTLDAEQAAEKARKAEADAIEARNEAENRRLEAVESSKLAESRRLEAEANLRLAEENEKRANQQTIEANNQKELAVKASEEAYQRRMLSIARSMAVKSLQIDNDPNLKGLLAYQAYLLNERYGGLMHDVDIYSGLYAARKALMGEQYNVYEGHSQTVRAIAFKPGSDIFFSAGSDGQILAWALSDTSKSYATISNEPMVIQSLSVSSDGKWLACGTDGNGIMLFSLDKPVGSPQTLSGHQNAIRDVEFLPGSNDIFSIGVDKTILRWKYPYALPEVFASSETRLSDITVSDDAKMLAASDRAGNILIYSLLAPDQPYVISGTTANPVLSLDFSSDGKYLVTGDMKGNVRLYRTAGWEVVNNLRGNKARINSVRFSP
ncbi:MAG: hypothetical protein ACOYXB_11430, partial [Bacteroidota bacterium]